MFPAGGARLADPDVGFHVDFVAIGVGVTVLAAFMLTVGVVAARRASRTSDTGGGAAQRRRSTVLEQTARAGFSPRSPADAHGARTRTGERAVPVRSAYVGGLSASSASPRSSCSGRASPISRPRPSCTAGISTSGPPDNTIRMAGRNGRRRCRPGPRRERHCCAVTAPIKSTVGMSPDGRQAAAGHHRPGNRRRSAPTAPNEIALGTKTLSAIHAKSATPCRPSRDAPSIPRRRPGGLPQSHRRGHSATRRGRILHQQRLRSRWPRTTTSRVTSRALRPEADRARCSRRSRSFPISIPTRKRGRWNTARGASPASVPPEIDRLRRVDSRARLGALPRPRRAGRRSRGRNIGTPPKT